MSPFMLKRKQQPPQEGITPMTFGNRTPEQIAAALEKAHDARRIRSRVLAQVRSGELTLGRVLSGEFDGDPIVQRIPVDTLLRALPGVGPKGAADVMTQLGIPEKRRVSGLGVNQREKLVAWRVATR